MPKFVFFIPFWLLLISVELVLAQQKFPVSSISSSMKENALATVRDEVVDIQMKSKTAVLIEIYKVVTVHNHLGKEFGEIDLYYNKSRKVESVKGEIYDEFGNLIVKFTRKDFVDESAYESSNMYDDVRIKSFSPTIYKYPYTIAYTVKLSQSQNLSLPVWSPNHAYDLSVEKSQYSFSCNLNEEVRLQEQNYKGKLKKDENNKIKTYTWSLTNEKASRNEVLSPPRHQISTMVRIVPNQFQYYKRSGSFSNWEEAGKWKYDELLADKRRLPENTVQHIKFLTKDVDSVKERAKIIYKYLQEKTRYISIQVGIGGLEPIAASVVDELGYGDCKALVNYMQSLLDVVNIPSYYCVVEASKTKIDLSTDFANFADGNHIILCIPFENDTTWLECTSSNFPFGYLGSFTDDRLVLACSSEGGKLLRTPKFSAQESTQFRFGDLKILPDGSLEGTIQTRFTGAQLENHFFNAFQNGQEQIKNLSKWYDIDNISFRKIAYEIDEKVTPLSIVEKLNLHIKSNIVRTEKHAVLQPNIFNFASLLPAIITRRNQVYINQSYTDIDSITFELSPDMMTNVLPIDEHVETAMANYHLKLDIVGNRLICYRKLQFISGNYPPESYEDLRNMMVTVSRIDRVKYNIPIKVN